MSLHDLYASTSFESAYPYRLHTSVESHLLAWNHGVKLDLHLMVNHRVRPSSNRKDWSVQHEMAHDTETDPHGYWP